MNICVVSDTHGNQNYIKEAIARQGPFDCLIHLGDGVRDGIVAAGQLNIPFYGVCGNEDFGVTLPDTLRLVLDSWTFFLMHGQQMDISVYQSPQVWDGHLAALAALARKEKAQVLLFGHTHRPLLTQVDGAVIVNPGDQYIGSATPPSFAAMKLSPETLNIKILLREQEPDGNWVTLIEHNIYQPGG
jgi:putative phosphoesterase